MGCRPGRLWPRRSPNGGDDPALVGNFAMLPEVEGLPGAEGQLAGDKLVSVELRWRDARGALQQETIQLLPGGWYTILLGRERGVKNECK